MVVVCQQPNYFPWLGYLEQCARADRLVILDSVQWIRQGRQHRTRVLTHAPDAACAAPGFQWLTIPVHGHGHREKPLRELEVDRADRWAERHWKTLATLYGGRPYFKSQLEPLVRPWLEKAVGMQRMAEIALGSTRLCLEALGLNPDLLMSSELPETGRKTERLVSICQALEADTYYSALGATRYVDVAAFRAAGIRLLWQHWKHPEYPQGRPAFRSHLSILDALANVPLSELRAWFQPSPYGPFAAESPSI